MLKFLIIYSIFQYSFFGCCIRTFFRLRLIFSFSIHFLVIVGMSSIVEAIQNPGKFILLVFVFVYSIVILLKIRFDTI